MSVMQLRKLRAADFAAAQALSASFGWPHRLEDWAFMHRLGRGCVAVREGVLLGTAMGWTFGRNRAALGMVAVAAECQGQGIGRRLLETLITGLGRRTIVLHATEAGTTLYRALGFQPAGLVRQHEGAAFAARLVPLESGTRLRPIGRSDPGMLAALDQAASGMDRGTMLAALLATAFGVVLDREGEAIGFAVLRRFGRGHVIGPVVAPDAGTARALIGHFLAANPGQFMRIDVPDTAGLSPWLAELGLTEVGPALRMVRGPEPPVAGPPRSFALVSQAFG
jgi:ribosomal protein S18 acetylase RimI-like enzyme